jgi:histidinol-phosphate aminotransferase
MAEFDIKKLFKDHIQKASRYNPTAILESLYDDGLTFARMMGNESPYPPSPRVFEAISGAFDRIGWYPDSSNTDLKRAISSYTSLPEERIIAGNGSSELIDLVYQGFIKPGSRAVIPIPSYRPYTIRLGLFGGEPINVGMRDLGLGWDVEDLLKAIRTGDPALLVLASPNNPTGTTTPIEDLERLLDEGIPIILDEAYFEFSGRSLVSLIEGHDNLIVLRTLSKAFGLAGLRIGYALGDRDLIEYLEKIKNPFNIDNISEQAAIAALGDIGYLKKCVKKIVDGRTRLFEKLSHISGIRVYPSQANFILVKILRSDLTSMDLMLKLLDQGLLVRDYTGKLGLEGEFLRITVGDDSSNMRLVEALSCIFGR